MLQESISIQSYLFDVSSAIHIDCQFIGPVIGREFGDTGGSLRGPVTSTRGLHLRIRRRPDAPLLPIKKGVARGLGYLQFTSVHL